MTRMSLTLAAATALALGACGAGVLVPGSTPTTGTDRPPNLMVISGQERLELEPWAYCWTTETQGVCADGMPPDPLPGFESPVAELSIEYPIDWPMTTSFYPDGEGFCRETKVIAMDGAGDPFPPPVPAGRHEVEVFAQGNGGDGIWSFAIETTADNNPPPPHAVIYWYTNGDQVDAETILGVTLSNLPVQPEMVAVSATISDADGEPSEIELQPSLDPTCWVSQIPAESAPGLGGAASTVGSPPYEIGIDFDLDGKVWSVEPVSWPEDFLQAGNTSEWLTVGTGG